MKKSLLIISAITMLFSGKVFSQSFEFMTVYDPVPTPYTLPSTVFNTLFLGYPNVVTQVINGANWENTEKFSNPKNAQGNYTQLTTYTWNTTTSLWDISDADLHFTYSYNGNNKMIAFTRTYNDVSTGDVMKRIATNITYNGNNITQIDFIDSLYDVANSAWYALVGNEAFTYAGSILSNRVSTYTSYNGVPLNMPFNKISYSYNGNSVIEELSQSYDSQNSVWQDDSRKTFTYSGNKITSIIQEDYNTDLSVWEAGDRADYTYDGSNRVATVNYNNSETVQTYTYNANNKISEIISIESDGTNNKIDVTFDANNEPQVAYSYAWTGTAYSTVSGERTLWSDPNPNPEVPAAPTNLSVDPVKVNQVLRLIWTDNSDNETGFKIERSTDGTNFTLLTDITNANTTTYDDTNLPDATTYYYRVLAYNADGNSTFSNIANATTWSASLINIVADKGTVYPNPFNNTLNISWVENGNYSILSLNGTVIQNGKIEKGINKVDLSKVVSGSYILQINTDGNITNTMLIKE